MESTAEDREAWNRDGGRRYGVGVGKLDKDDDGFERTPAWGREQFRGVGQASIKWAGQRLIKGTE